MRPISYNKADVIAIFFALDDRNSLQNASNKWIKEVKQLGPKCPTILVGTKLDLREKIMKSTDKEKIASCITYAEGRQTAKQYNFTGYVECSAAQNVHLDKVIYVALEAVTKFRGDITRSTSISMMNDMNSMAGPVLFDQVGSLASPSDPPKKKKKWFCSVL